MEITPVKVRNINTNEEYKHYLARELCSYRQQIRKTDPDSAEKILTGINGLGFDVEDLRPGVIRFKYLENEKVK